MELYINNGDLVGYDLSQIALAIKNTTFDDEFICTFICNGYINSCEECNFKTICDDIKQASDNYYKHSTKVINTFDFNK